MVMEDRVANLEASMAEVKDDIAAIRAAVVGATKIGQFVKKQAPRGMAYFLGVATAAGWMNEATAHFFRALIGG